MFSRIFGVLIALISIIFVSQYVSPNLREVIPAIGLLCDQIFHAWSLVRPGGVWHPTAFLEIHGHLFLEGILLIVITYLVFFQTSFKPRANAENPLTESEIQNLCDEWEPDPLEGRLTPFQKVCLAMEPEIISHNGRTVLISMDNKKKEAIDMCSLNFLGLSGESGIREAARQTIHKYGVGSCGPRGFYGTLDVHLDLEERLAKFMGTQEAILYSYDLATIPSILPAFANRKDLIVMDEACSWPSRNGACLSRARVIYFRHNNISDLERVLRGISMEDKKKRRPINRRFIVVEGIYADTGEISPLSEIVELKRKYKYRLIVDESISLGILGRNGRGAIDQAGLNPSDVEIIGASLGNALASIGGFCCGDREIVDHQRLSGAGYCFSASLPPYLASASIAALDIIEKEGSLRSSKVRELARKFRLKINESAHEYGFELVGDKSSLESPLIHIRLLPEPPLTEWDSAEMILNEIVQEMLQRTGILTTVTKYSAVLERGSRPPPSIRIAINALHEVKDIDLAVQGLRTSFKSVVNKESNKLLMSTWNKNE